MSQTDPTTTTAASGPDPAEAPRADPPSARARRRRWPYVLGGAVVVLAGGYLAGYLAAGDQVPRDAVVAGVAIGRLDRDAAAARLAEQLGPRVAAPVRVSVDGREQELTDTGLGVDYPATVTAAGAGRSADPRHVWRVLTGGGEVEPVLRVDGQRWSGTLERLADAVAAEPVDASVTIASGKATTRPGRDGVALDVAAADQAVRVGLLGQSVITLPAATTPPEITDADVAALRTATIDPALSAPIEVAVSDDDRFRLTPTMIGKGLKISTSDGTVTADLDPAALSAAAKSEIDDVELEEPRNATVVIKGGKPVVVPAVNGTTLAADDLAAAVRPALTKTGNERTVTVALSGAEAERSTADAEKLGIKEVTGQYTTYFPYANYRNVNIARAAELINGTVLEPGDTFSLNGIVGERTRANGFTEGNIITGGKFRLELGGGVSQSATTTYNAMFFAGLKDVEHQPHTLFINRYPPGREATVAWPNLDLKFTNDTEHGVLVQASVVKSTPSSRGSITVKMWSTKTWDKITSTDLQRSNFTTGRDLTDDDPKCQPMDPVQGFDVNYARLFYRDGAVAKRENFFWRYAPTDRVRCS